MNALFLPIQDVMSEHISAYQVRVCHVKVNSGLIVFGSLQASDSGKFKTFAAFECRGVEPVAFDPRVCSILMYLFVCSVCCIISGWILSSG